MISKLKIIGFLVVGVLLTGCTTSNYKSIMSVENNLPNLMQMTYQQFEGWKYKNVRFKAGDVVTFNVDLETTEGELEVSILDSQNEPIFSVETPTEHVSEEIKIEVTGTYKIKVSGTHSGSYSISWDK